MAYKGTMGKNMLAAVWALFVAAGCAQEVDEGEVNEGDFDETQAHVERPDYADCGGSFRLEAGFDDEQREGVENSVRRWNVWVGREYFKLSVGGACPIVAVAFEGSAGASYNVDTGRIRMDLTKLRRLELDRGQAFEGVVMHELGHSVGMRDLNAVAIMGTVALDFTEADLVECRRVEFCR